MGRTVYLAIAEIDVCYTAGLDSFVLLWTREKDLNQQQRNHDSRPDTSANIFWLISTHRRRRSKLAKMAVEVRGRLLRPKNSGEFKNSSEVQEPA
jgi:hypothetical protein